MCASLRWASNLARLALGPVEPTLPSEMAMTLARLLEV
jgi:hypothetical protein